MSPAAASSEEELQRPSPVHPWQIGGPML